MTKMTTEELAAIRARADKATPMPWDTHTGNVIRAIKGDFAVPIFESRAPLDWHKNKRLTDAVMRRAFSDEHNNAAFIAAARQDVPALLSHVDTIANELSQAQAELAAMLAGAPDGWVLVPTADNLADADPGCNMVEVICNAARVCGGSAQDIYRDLLAAAPQPPAQAVARPEAAVKAEALREMAGWFSMAESLEQKAGNQWSADLVAGRLRAEAGRLEREGACGGVTMSLRTINNPPQIVARGPASQEIAAIEFFLGRPLREQQEEAMQNLAEVVARMAQRGVE